MANPPENNTMPEIGVRLRKARKERGLTQEQLAGAQFTKGYVSALERGSVRPSLKALEYLASNLQLPLSHFLSGLNAGAVAEKSRGAAPEPELDALQEDLNYQYNYARMLIRSGSVDDAFSLIKTADGSATLYRNLLPARLLYRPSFLRGLGYLQQSDPTSALPELESALEAAGSDKDAQITVRNMLGVAYYLLGKAEEAIKQHLLCLEAIESGDIKDLSLRLSILRNLANDYWALNDVNQAIGIYRKALPIVEDLDGGTRQAEILWAMAIAYRADNDWARAKLYATRALHLYEATANTSGAAIVYLHLSELMMKEERFRESADLLDKAEPILLSSNDNVLLSNLHYDYADLYRKQGDNEQAAEHAQRALTYIEKEFKETKGKGARKTAANPPLNIVRTYVEALHTAGLVEEDRGSHESADAYFNKAGDLAKNTELVELIHSIAFSYADMLNARGEFRRAGEQYRIAAQSSTGKVRPYV